MKTQIILIIGLIGPMGLIGLTNDWVGCLKS